MAAHKISIALTQEIYRTPKLGYPSGLRKNFQEFKNTNGKVTIISGLGTSPFEIHKCEFFLTIKIKNHLGSYLITNVYISPTANFEQAMLELNDLLINYPGPQLIAGDWNAASSLWGYSDTNNRGSQLIDIMLKFNLNLLNTLKYKNGNS